MKMKVARILAMIGAGVLCVFIGKFTLQNYLLIGLVGGGCCCHG